MTTVDTLNDPIVEGIMARWFKSIVDIVESDQLLRDAAIAEYTQKGFEKNSLILEIILQQAQATDVNPFYYQRALYYLFQGIQNERFIAVNPPFENNNNAKSMISGATTDSTYTTVPREMVVVVGWLCKTIGELACKKFSKEESTHILTTLARKKLDFLRWMDATDKMIVLKHFRYLSYFHEYYEMKIKEF